MKNDRRRPSVLRGHRCAGQTDFFFGGKQIFFFFWRINIFDVFLGKAHQAENEKSRFDEAQKTISERPEEA